MDPNIAGLLGSDQTSILQQQLAAVAPGLGITMPQTQQPTFPAGVGPIIDIPGMESPLQEVEGYDPSMEKGSWAMYTDIQSAKDIQGLRMSPLESICECNQNKEDLSALNAQCGVLTEYNCKRVGCCVYTSNNKCLAGNKNGPTAESGTNLDYYYYKNKCYGSKCPPKRSCKK